MSILRKCTVLILDTIHGVYEWKNKCIHAERLLKMFIPENGGGTLTGSIIIRVSQMVCNICNLKQMDF